MRKLSVQNRKEELKTLREDNKWLLEAIKMLIPGETDPIRKEFLIKVWAERARTGNQG
jgi:hypothetical protein